MQYDLYDFGDRPKGTILEITLSTPTTIRLVDKVNFDIFQHGADYRCAKKYVNVSPYRVVIPEDRHWYLMIEPVKNLKHSVKIIMPRNP